MRALRWNRWKYLGLLAAMGLAACGGGSSGSTNPGPRIWGYIQLPDGNKMRYSVVFPKGPGPFPVLMEYDGYGSGSVTDQTTQEWTKEGYAVMGLNVPGTGCSTGENQWADASVGAAGAHAVEWAVWHGLFAYNEAPTIAVANDCWFRARRHSTRPFFLCAPFSPHYLTLSVDESHQKFLHHRAHRPWQVDVGRPLDPALRRAC